jgi:hypothetical protein
MITTIVLWTLLGFTITALGAAVVRSRNLQTWILSYVRDRIPRARPHLTGEVTDVLVCIADHFEPLWGSADDSTAQRRMDLWMKRFPALAARHRDSDGRPPVHTFFFPGEQYRPRWLSSLAELCEEDLAEVEIHLHHGYDTEEGMRRKLSEFRDQLARHRLLSVEDGLGKIRYAFIHGNYALANSGSSPDSCGVDGELKVLWDTGCYADMTLPSAPSSTQIPTVNRLFFVPPTQKGFKPHAYGTEAGIGRYREDELLLIEGPLTLDWTHRKFGLLPRIENSELSADNPPNARRIPLWMTTKIHVLGRPEWQFVKLHTHGAPEKNHEPILGKSMDDMLSALEERFANRHHRLHYVSAREMYNIARAAMDGKRGNAGDFRDYKLRPLWKVTCA